MVTYPKVSNAIFLERPNRFIACCRICTNNEEVVVHVKNTGRCRELLREGVEVSISYQASATRKTAYDLIAVKKDNAWINIDSQVPNELAYEGLKNGDITLPNIKGNITTIQREVTFDSSRFDIYFETDTQEKVVVEVKGMTLENHQVGAFPDAPSARAVKHVKKLISLANHGYHVCVLFIAQTDRITSSTVHKEMDIELYNVIKAGILDGLTVLTYNCVSQPNTIQIKKQIPFNIDSLFVDPNKESGGV